MQQEVEDLLVDRTDVLKLQPAPVSLVARHGSLQPQENDDEDQVEESEDPKQRKEHVAELPRRLSDWRQVKKAKATPSTSEDSLHEDPPTTLLPELELICTLTRRIAAKLSRENLSQQELEGDEDEENNEHDDPASLAYLFCRRAKTLLHYVKFDASATIPMTLLEALDPGLTGSDTRFLTTNELWAVKQAQADALATIAADSRLPDAYFVAAQCARSLGKTEEAIEHVGNALRLTPQRKKLHTLMRQLYKDLGLSRVVISPSLLCHSVADVDDADLHQQDQLNDVDEEQEADTLCVDVKRRFGLMEALAGSPLLLKLEPMIHEALHHQCASGGEALALTIALSQTTEFLRVLLRDSATTSKAILLDPHVLENAARQLADPRALVESPNVRRWVVKTLAPAVVQSVPDDFGSGSAYEAVASASQRCRAALLRDVLLTLTRLLLASGSLQRCTNVPTSLATLKMAYDLTKQLASEAALAPLFGPLEMACADGYALALLDLADESGEALLLHQQSLKMTVALQNRDRELRSRHLIGRALLKLRELEASRAEFAQLVTQSQALGDSAMECLALYQLGEVHVALGDLDHGMRLFEAALVVCNQTAQCQHTWRLGSIQRAIAFYACMRPPRRRGVVTRPVETAATLVMAPPGDASWAWAEQDAPQPRRAAVWMTAPLALETPQAKSLAETVLGDYETTESQEKPKPKRDARWRDSVFAVPSREPEESENEEQTSGPLTTHGVSLASWLLARSDTSPTRPACCKPLE